MTWIPIHESGIAYSFARALDYLPGPDMVGSVVGTYGAPTQQWWLNFDDEQSRQLRIIPLAYSSTVGASFISDRYENHWFSPEAPDSWAQFEVYADGITYFPGYAGEVQDEESYEFLIEVWEEDGPPPSSGLGYKVYELDRGWTFDGMYIPHFLELNWYFGDDPIHYHSVQKVRVHGTSKGFSGLTLAVNGMQTDYEEDYSEPQVIDLPRSPKHISTELLPMTNYTDTANRGLSIQMKFEGRNTDPNRPEPQHVLQVLTVQSSPAGTGFRAN